MKVDRIDPHDALETTPSLRRLRDNPLSGYLVKCWGFQYSIESKLNFLWAVIRK